MPDYKLRLWDDERQYAGASPRSPQKIQGQRKFDSITLERGVVPDAAFADWAAGLVAGSGSPPSDSDSSSPQKVTGVSKFNSIPLKRGVVPDTGFNSWASGVGGSGVPRLGSEASQDILGKDIHLEFYNESWQLLVRYRITRGWVSEYQVLPPGGVLLHNLQRRTGKSVQETLATIFEESLRRLRHPRG